MKVSVAQLYSDLNVTNNLNKIIRQMREAASEGSRVVAFPEAAMAMDLNASAAQLQALANERTGDFLGEIGVVAKALHLDVFVGVYEATDESRPSNDIVHVTCQGTVAGRYEKLHLYDAFGFKESDKVRPGTPKPDGAELYQPEIDGLKFGLMNCYDLRFPELARLYVQRGADVLVYSAGWVAGNHKEMHWSTLLQARAIENTCYVMASDQPPSRSIGLSRTIDPLGLVLAGVATTEGVATTDITRERLDEAREALPSLRHRRYRVFA
ncbi:nitrilase-related carbon-nitrogen hydrolase [Burkholderia sp. GS2Y]|uniref:Nitrilase-related carbon-nitrogen hydrolase n=1 Tax=Burkholderia theae TaxID=3143496 RepID=A0ABU9WSR9_9BURK